jgi:hypothetical protein
MHLNKKKNDCMRSVTREWMEGDCVLSPWLMLFQNIFVQIDSFTLYLYHKMYIFSPAVGHTEASRSVDADEEPCDGSSLRSVSVSRIRQGLGELQRLQSWDLEAFRIHPKDPFRSSSEAAADDFAAFQDPPSVHSCSWPSFVSAFHPLPFEQADRFCHLGEGDDARVVAAYDGIQGAGGGHEDDTYAVVDGRVDVAAFADAEIVAVVVVVAAAAAAECGGFVPHLRFHSVQHHFQRLSSRLSSLYPPINQYYFFRGF